MKFVTDLGKGVLGQADPVELWEEITNNIPDSILLKPDVKILSVACGHCTEAVVIAKRMIALGINKEQVNNSIYLIDKYSVFTNYSKLNFGFKNVITCDFLEWKTDMEFDVIVGNPPYKLGGNKNFYVSFIKKANSLLKEGGFFSYVIPNRFLSPSSVSSKSLSGWLNVTEVRPSVNNHFPDIGTSIGTVSGIKNKDSVFTKAPFIFENGDTILRSLDQPTPIVNPTKITTDIVSKVFDSKLPKLFIKNKSDSTNFVFVEVSYNRYRSTTPTGGEKTLVTSVNKTNGTGGYIDFSTKDHAELNSWFLSKSKLGRFIIYCFANTSFATSSPVHHGFMPQIPKSISKNDQEIYNFFGITKNEILEIEKVIL